MHSVRGHEAADIAQWNERWNKTIVDWVRAQMANSDAGHGLEHVQRVVCNAIQLASQLPANPAVYLPAAWMHDCVAVPKNSPQRSQASRLAAQHASAFLMSIQYPAALIREIEHCIESHSFSANIPCRTIEAKIVQDADRLEAVGAIGLARCLMTGGSMGQRLYHPDDPFPIERAPADTEQSVDHFFSKLLGLHRTMQTDAGRNEAKSRTEFLISFLKQLGREIGRSDENVAAAICRADQNP